MKDLDTAVNEIVCDGVTTQMKATEQYTCYSFGTVYHAVFLTQSFWIKSYKAKDHCNEMSPSLLSHDPIVFVLQVF